jgi:hypothetical protein
VAARAGEFAGEITRQIADAFQARDELPSRWLQAATRGNRACGSLFGSRQLRHVLQGSGRHLTEGIRFSPETCCDGFVFHVVFTRGLQFNPQALDACQPFAVFFDS